MSQIAATVLQDAVIKSGTGGFGKYEQRISTFGALQAFKDNANKLLPESIIENIKKSVLQVTKVPVLNKYTASVITSPTCNPTGNRPVSALQSLTWAFVGFEVQIIPSLNRGNMISLEDDLGVQLKSGWKGVLANLDTASVNKLETNKNAASATSNISTISTSGGVYDFTGDPKDFFLYLPGLMGINDIDGPFNDVANTESLSTILRIETLGLNNSENMRGILEGQLPYSLGVRNYMTNRLSPGSHKEVHYLFPDGAVGVYNWVDPDSVAGYTAGNKSWQTMQDPYFGFNWGLYKVADCIDASAQSSGLTRAYGEIWQVGAYFAFLTDYSSDTTTPIIKVIFEDSGS